MIGGFPWHATLSEVACKASIVLLLGAFCSLVLRRSSASLRHAAWVATIVGTLLIPLAIPFAPSLPIVPSSDINEIVGSMRSKVERPSAPDTAATPPAVRRVDPGDAAWTTKRSEVASAATPTTIATLLWGLGVCCFAIRALIARLTLRFLRIFGTQPLPLSRDLFHLGRRIGANQAWELRRALGTEPATALTWGLLRPVVLLPKDSDRWSRQRTEAVLLHELAHVRRGDVAWHLLAELACALYWFNPLIWYAARSMRMEAESAADDAVLRAGVAPTEYADQLLQLAAEIGRHRQPFLRSGIPAMNPTKLELRLRAILSNAGHRRGLTSSQVLSAIVASCLTLPAIAGLQSSATPKANHSTPAERNEALDRIKKVAMGTLMYVTDYDDMTPYAQDTATVINVTRPYVRNMKTYQSPTKGGRFVFNLNLAGVSFAQIESPQSVPMWTEVLPDPQMQAAIAFADGHAKLFGARDRLKMAALAKKRFPRPANAKPLPKNFSGG